MRRRRRRNGRERPAAFVVSACAFCYGFRTSRLRERRDKGGPENGMGQDIFDVIIILTLVAFSIRGFLKGFVAEVAGIVSLLGGFWVAHHFHPLLSPRLTFISEPAWRTIAAYVLLFIAVMIVVGIVARILQKILTFSFVGWADKLIGGALGLTKGLILCSLVLLVLQKLFGNAPFLQNSRALPYFNSLIETIRQGIPPDLLSRLGLA